MQKISALLGLGSIALLGTLAIVTSAEPAQASFTCGPNMQTYRVTATNGQLGGVRCVKFTSDQTTQGASLNFAWYGEGKWGNTKYRHVGYAATDRPSGKPINYAADIYGNGENTAGSFSNLVIQTSGDRSKIRVTGDWNEIWTLASNNTVSDYTSSLAPLNSCGQHFTRYVVSDANDQTTNGTGVRCRIKGYSFAWYGEGNWNGRTYAHLGTFLYQGIGASDICEPSKFKSCGDFPNGSLKITGSTVCKLPEKLRVKGAWNEVWTNLPSTKVCID